MLHRHSDKAHTLKGKEHQVCLQTNQLMIQSVIPYPSHLAEVDEFIIFEVCRCSFDYTGYLTEEDSQVWDRRRSSSLYSCTQLLEATLSAGELDKLAELLLQLGREGGGKDFGLW